MKFGKWVVKCRIPILILAVALLVPSLIGMIMTRINYDMLTYLPGDIDTVVGQDILMDEFGKGAFSFVIIEGMDPKDVSSLREDISHVDHVDTVLWYDDFADVSVPMEILPSKLYDAFNSGDSTMLAIFFDTSTSSDDTMEAITAIRSIAGKQCFVSGMSAMVTDLKDLCEKEEPIYVGIAVALACVAMMIFMDNWITPFVFLMSIGMAILLNMGTNYFLGEISYLTKALSAVLQLAVTMDYSIFLWHSYEEQKSMYEDNKEAMAVAINNTLTSVVGSSITTVAGFIALCFMSYTLGLDLGIVMAKGVILGVIGCVTTLPSMILVLDKLLQKTSHKSLLPDMGKVASGITKVFPVFLILFLGLVLPSYLSYKATNNEVYYDLGETLPEDMAYVVANSKLQEDFGVGATHMVLVSTDVSDTDVRAMIHEMENVEGIKYALGLESVVHQHPPDGNGGGFQLSGRFFKQLGGNILFVLLPAAPAEVLERFRVNFLFPWKGSALDEGKGKGLVPCGGAGAVNIPVRGGDGQNGLRFGGGSSQRAVFHKECAVPFKFQPGEGIRGGDGEQGHEIAVFEVEQGEHGMVPRFGGAGIRSAVQQVAGGCPSEPGKNPVSISGPAAAIR